MSLVDALGSPGDPVGGEESALFLESGLGIFLVPQAGIAFLSASLGTLLIVTVAGQCQAGLRPRLARAVAVSLG